MFNTLTVVIVILLVLVVGDGVRRFMINRRNRLDVSPALKERIRNPGPDYEASNEPPPSYISFKFVPFSRSTIIYKIT